MSVKRDIQSMLVEKSAARRMAKEKKQIVSPKKTGLERGAKDTDPGSKSVFQKEIHKRFKFLDGSLEDEQDEEIYKLTKTVALEVLRYLSFEASPLIGIDNSGQVIVEWHDYRECRIIRIIPAIQNKVIFQGIKTNGTSFTINSNLHNIKENDNKDLARFIPG
jgi:hypothetical protein